MAWKKILRWFAVLPATVGGLLVGSIVVNLFGMIQRWFTGMDSDGGNAKIFFWIISSLAGGALAVYWGARVAPSHRKIVGTVLAALVLIFAVIGFLVSSRESGWFWPLMSAISFAVGAGYVMHQIYEEGEDFNLFG